MDGGERSAPAQRLLQINIINAHGLVIVQTIWATTGDRRAGHRLTRTETIAGPAALTRRLDELVPLSAGHLPEAVADVDHDRRAAA
jgi:hypothetical protein